MIIQGYSQKTFRILYVILGIFLSYNNLTPQVLEQKSGKSAKTRDNEFLIGVNKIANTYIFTADASADLDVLFGNIKINQNYRSTAIESGKTSIRDDESFQFQYSYPFSSFVTILAKQNWILSSDSRSTKINELMRLNGIAGIRLDFDKIAVLELNTGLEENNQIGYKSTGYLFNANAVTKDINLLDYKFKSTLSGEYVSLNQGRENSDLDLRIGLNRKFTTYDMMDFGINYKAQGRDFISQLSNPGFSLEHRNENDLMANLGFRYKISENIKSDFFLSAENTKYERQDTILKNRNDFIINFNGNFYYNIKSFSQRFGLAYFVRNEDYGVQMLNKNIPVVEKLYETENQKDNRTARTSLFSRTDWKLTRRDSINLEYSASIKQFDSPSDDNNDDRDEFNSFIKGNYSRRFNKNLRLGITSELHLHHLVFLKSERSAMNKWNRIISLKPSVQYMNKYFSIMPQFEVVANYTVYDFESESSGIKSYSHRQIGYRDSIMVQLFNNITLQSNILLRYSERGILFWKSFSEAPRSSNMETFLKAMFIFEAGSITNVGCGVRYYSLLLDNQLNNTNSSSAEAFKQESFGPEALFSVSFGSGNEIIFRGWYEFQSTGEKEFKTIPNFYILTKLYL